MKKYIVLAILPDEPYLIYYCGSLGNKKPLFNEAAGLIKKMPLKEAEEVFSAIGSSNKEIIICLMEWGKFVDVYQSLEVSKENLMANSIKTK